MAHIKPIKFTPLLKPKIWGGERIAPFKGLQTDMRKIGESWEISSVAESETVVAEGDDAGLTTSQMVEKYGARLLGEHVYAAFGNNFPILIKFIDAAENLSLQVHPDDDMAYKYHGCKGKTEMWYIIDAKDCSAIMSGFSKHITPEEYERRVADNTILQVVARYDTKAGDLFYLPPGGLHSIGAGIFLVEIQQTSNITYRVYDFDRVDADGKRRELHTKYAKEALDYRVFTDRMYYDRNKFNGEAELVNCKYFKTSVIKIGSGKNLNINTEDSFRVVICTKGDAVIEDSFGNTATLATGETVLLPAESADITIHATELFEAITAWL